MGNGRRSKLRRKHLAVRAMPKAKLKMAKAEKGRVMMKKVPQVARVAKVVRMRKAPKVQNQSLAKKWMPSPQNQLSPSMTCQHCQARLQQVIQRQHHRQLRAPGEIRLPKTGS